MRKTKRKTKESLSSPPSSKKGKQETEYYPEFQLEEKYPELSRKKSSPQLTPSIELESFFPDGKEDVEKKIKKEPEWIPFWRHPDEVIYLEERKKTMLPYFIYDWLYRKPLTIEKSIEYHLLANDIIEFILQKKYPNTKYFKYKYVLFVDTNEIIFYEPHILKKLIIKACSPPVSVKYDISLIRLGLLYRKRSDIHFKSGHLQLLIINHIHKTIEFYDPGYSPENYEYLEYINTNIEERVMTILKNDNIRGYTWKQLNETCPKVNLQYFENKGYLPEPVRNIGFCVFWGAFIAEIRIMYASYSPKTIKRILNKIIKRLNLELMLDYSGWQGMNPFMRFIYEYVLYWEKKYRGVYD